MNFILIEVSIYNLSEVNSDVKIRLKIIHKKLDTIFLISIFFHVFIDFIEKLSGIIF